MPINDAELKALIDGLEAGTQFASGRDRLKLIDGKRAIQSLVTGRFVKMEPALEVYRTRYRDEVMKWLASEVALILEKNIEYFTGSQYSTLRELAAAGHPYARRHFNGRFRDPLGRFTAQVVSYPGGGPQFVNRQDYRGMSNSLSMNFNYDVARNASGAYKVVAANPVLHAGLLAEGTNKMIARPYDRFAVERTNREAAAVIRDGAAALAKAGLDTSGVKMPEIDFVLGNVRRQYR